MRVAALAGNRIDRFDVVGPHLVEALVGERHDLVLANAGLERLRDVLVDAVDHRRGRRQQRDLVGRFDQSGVEHDLLGVLNLNAGPLQLEHHRRLGDIHTEWHPGDAGGLQLGDDLRDGTGDESRVRCDRAAQPEHSRSAVLGSNPRSMELVMSSSGSEVPDDRFAPACQQHVAGHLVTRPLADHRGRDVADVVDVEEEHRAELRCVERSARASKPVGAQAREVDPFLEVDIHATGAGRRPALGSGEAHRGYLLLAIAVDRSSSPPSPAGTCKRCCCTRDSHRDT